MTDYIGSELGVVKTKKVTFEEPLKLESGNTLPRFTLAYETYGSLDKDKTNVILIVHALSGDAHVAGVSPEGAPGWWSDMVGPGAPIDTNHFFVICSNVIGGCKGSTGPSSINPSTGKPYGLSFPVITIKDMVKAQKRLLDYLGISHVYAVIGGSMGGMQVLEWIVSYPKMVRLAVVIATSARSSPQTIALNEVGRVAIMSDPNWRKGDYYGKEPPRKGLALARMIGHISYLSDESMRSKFGRRFQNKTLPDYKIDLEFAVESYLHHQGEKFVRRFDANSYLYITRAIDYFDLTQGGKKTLKEVFTGVEARVFVIGISSDWLYPTSESKDIVMGLHAAGVDVIYQEMESLYGHDAFLVEKGQMGYLLRLFLSNPIVKDIMTTRIPTISPDQIVSKAAEIMLASGMQQLPVVDNEGVLSGIVTAWDLCKSFVKGTKTVAEVMTRDVITAKPSDTVAAVARRMQRESFSAFPVVDASNHVLGMVTLESASSYLGGHLSFNPSP
ncbi:MAG: homoserine O-acetyltransferase MetX [Candidatus Ranarchaeia archaeon]